MSFFSESDQAARNGPPKPSGEEVEEYSRRKALEELPQVLESIRQSYRSKSHGIHFVFEYGPLSGQPASAMADKVDARVVCKELVRLVELETDLVCTGIRHSHSSRSEFGVSF